MSRPLYLAIKCAQDRAEAERLVAGDTKPSHRFAKAHDMPDKARTELEHRAAVEAHEAAARHGLPIPREPDSRRLPYEVHPSPK
jgi:hypothetical protein